MIRIGNLVFDPNKIEYMAAILNKNEKSFQTKIVFTSGFETEVNYSLDELLEAMKMHMPMVNEIDMSI